MLASKDMYRYGYSGFWGWMKAMLIPGFKYIFFFRVYKKFTWLRPIVKFVLRFLSRWYGIQIELDTEIGEGFYIGHFGTIVVNGNTVFGRNCNISHGVTIGATNRGKQKGSPTIGDSVWIGAHAIIVGKIKIGNNVLIAPGAFVNVDVLENSLCIGNPCKIIQKGENPTIGYVNNKI